MSKRKFSLKVTMPDDDFFVCSDESVRNIIRAAEGANIDAWRGMMNWMVKLHGWERINEELDRECKPLILRKWK